MTAPSCFKKKFICSGSGSGSGSGRGSGSSITGAPNGKF